MNMANKTFLRQTVHGYKRLGNKWRAPRGSQSKMRKEKAGKRDLPKVGRGTALAWRGMHPSGRFEFFVRNLHDLSRVNEKTQAIRVSSAVGGKAKEEIVKRAKEMGLTVLNP